jgi:hypothetical protein
MMEELVWLIRVAETPFKVTDPPILPNEVPVTVIVIPPCVFPVEGFTDAIRGASKYQVGFTVFLKPNQLVTMIEILAPPAAPAVAGK